MKLRMTPLFLLMLASTTALGQESVVVHAGCTWTLPAKFKHHSATTPEYVIYSNLSTRGLHENHETVRFSRKQELFDQDRVFRQRFKRNSESHSSEFFLAKWHGLYLYDPKSLVPDTTVLQNKKKRLSLSFCITLIINPWCLVVA